MNLNKDKNENYNAEVSPLYIKICGKQARDYLRCLDSYNEITNIENKNKCKKYLDIFLKCNDYS